MALTPMPNRLTPVPLQLPWRRAESEAMAALPEQRRHRLSRAAGPVLGFVAGVGVATSVLMTWPGTRGVAEQMAPATPVVEFALIENRLQSVESRLTQTAQQASQAETLARRAEAMANRPMPASDRFLSAALLLQSSVSTARPWMREFQAMAALAPPDALPRSLHEVLASHAARGLPTEAELRDRFQALAPQLIARAPRDAGILVQAAHTARGAIASIGLAARPEPGEQETAIVAISAQLRRGNLAAAISDAAALDETLQPLLAGWLAQARARLAVEQAVQETLLRALAAGFRPT